MTQYITQNGWLFHSNSESRPNTAYSQVYKVGHTGKILEISDRFFTCARRSWLDDGVYGGKGNWIVAVAQNITKLAIQYGEPMDWGRKNLLIETETCRKELLRVGWMEQIYIMALQRDFNANLITLKNTEYWFIWVQKSISRCMNQYTD